MLIEDADSLGKAFFNLCASADRGTTMESDSEALSVWDSGVLCIPGSS